MLDPLTALGVAGNVLQIIDLGFQLVTDGNQIYHSTNGALEENKAADELAQDLQSLTKRLSDSQTAWTAAHGNVPLDPDEVHLRNICERCKDISIELQRQLQKLKHQDGIKRRRLTAYKQALISVWRKDQIDTIATRLARYQQELDTHILIGLRKSIQKVDWQNSIQFAALERRTQELTVAVLDADGNAIRKLDDQAEVLERIHEQTSQILSALGSDGRRATSPALTFDTTASASDSITTVLHEAAQAGELVKLKRLLRSSLIAINARDQDGCTPLHVASTGEIARKLLDNRGIEMNIEDDEGRTALHCAVLKRRLDVIQAILAAGADKSIQDDFGKTASFYAQDCPAALFMLTYGPETETKANDHLNNTGLMQMAWMGDLEGTSFYLDQGANINARNAWQETALSEASRHGSAEIVEMLIQKGANLELGPGNDWTCLLQAVRDNRVEIVRLLLKHGAKRDAKLLNGNTALVEACQNGFFEIAEMLVEAGCNIDAISHARNSPLKVAAAANRHTLVRMLVTKRADKEFKDAHGVTAVHEAADRGHAESLGILLDAGANPNVITNSGWSALGQACTHGHIQCVRLLIEHRVDVNAYQRHGSSFTALGEASFHGHLQVIELLLAHGARLENCCPLGFSALSSAAHSGQNTAVSFLAERGADVEQRGFGNRDRELDKTPLMRASIKGFDSTVELLLGLGAKVNAKDVHGTTALYYAAKRGHNDVVNILIHGGANINAQTNGGATALMAAAGEGYAEIVRQLLEANANPNLRDWRGCTAWVIAVNTNHNRELENLLKPADGEHDTLRQLQAERSPGEIAAYMNEIYH